MVYDIPCNKKKYTSKHHNIAHRRGHVLDFIYLQFHQYFLHLLLSCHIHYHVLSTKVYRGSCIVNLVWLKCLVPYWKSCTWDNHNCICMYMWSWSTIRYLCWERLSHDWRQALSWSFKMVNHLCLVYLPRNFLSYIGMWYISGITTFKSAFENGLLLSLHLHQ